MSRPSERGYTVRNTRSAHPLRHVSRPLTRIAREHGIWDANEKFTRSSVAARYAFDDLAPGVVRLAITPVGGYAFMSPQGYAVAVKPGVTARRNFGVTPIASP